MGEIEVESLETVLEVDVVGEETVACVWHLADMGHVFWIKVRYQVVSK